MIIAKVQLRRAPGAQGTLTKVLLDGAAGDRGHGLIWSLFSDSGAGARTFLYRQIDPGSFITVSERPPADAHNLWHIDSKDYAPSLHGGQRLRFVLRANPAMSARTPGAPRGLRVDAVMHAKTRLGAEERKTFNAGEAALDWLVARGPTIGAAFERERCSATGYQQIVVPKKGTRKPVTFAEIDYEGVLAVTDSTKLTAALFSGIGKARSYGCGLMLVRPT